MPASNSYSVTMNIKGEYLRAIVKGEQKVEHRAIKPYWDARLKDCKAPFLLRLINGMRPKAPEIIIEVVRVRKDKKPDDDYPDGVYCLHLGEIKSKKNMSKLVK
jgi:hypothetical protein